MDNDIFLRLGFFIGMLVIMAFVEIMYPRRTLTIKKTIRWSRNLSLVVMNSIIVRSVVPFTAVSVALYAEQHQIGLFYLFSMPLIFVVILSLFLLDLLIYAQHVMFHHIPLFWRFHKIHHIDQEIDMTTGVRFHPVEILLSTCIKSLVVLGLGIPFIAVIIFEILLNAVAIFNHSNIHIPKKWDRVLRYCIVTPDMHRVHHSIIPKEMHRNFGFNLSWWDWVFKTYQAQPKKNHLMMDIGLQHYRDIEKTTLLTMLMTPFYKKHINKKSSL